MIAKPKMLRRVAPQLALGLCAAAAVWGEARDAAADTADSDATIVVTGHRGSANPYADREAPFKVDRSASGKFTEDVQDTPKSIVILPKEAIESLGALSFKDLARTQPGVTIGTGEGGNAFGDRIFLRGFDARNDVFIDGVRDPGVGVREVFAVEQIEIVKGPSSAFAGRGASGGAISLVSKAPSADRFADVEATVGTDDTRRLTVDWNQPLSESLFLRVNGLAHSSGVAGRDYVESERWGWTAAMAWTPSDRLSFGADYYHLSTDSIPDWGVPYDSANNRPFNVRRENFYGVLARDFQETFADVYSLRGVFKITPNATLKSVLRYGQSGNAYTASAPERPNAAAGTVQANAKRRDAVTDYWTSQTDLTLRFPTGGVDHTLVLGVEFSEESTLNRQRAFTECAVLPCTGATSNPTLDLYNPDPTIPWGRATAVVSRPEIDTTTVAVYALDTLKFNRFVEAFVGLRYDDYEAETRGLTPNRASQSDLFNWHTGLVLKPSDDKSFYVSYGSAANPPCEQVDAFSLDYGGCDARVAALDPVENRTAEIGAKWSVAGGHMLLTTALFRIERDGVPVSLGGGAAPIGALQQAVDGFEITAAGNITERWSLFGGLTLLGTEITDSPIAAQIGAAFPNVSEQSFSLTSRHDLTDRLYVGATATYNSEKYGGGVEALTTQVPEFWRFDLFGAVEITDRVELSINVLNVGDEVYYDALYRSATPFTYIAPGRSALLTLDVDF